MLLLVSADLVSVPSWSLSRPLHIESIVRCADHPNLCHCALLVMRFFLTPAHGLYVYYMCLLPVICHFYWSHKCMSVMPRSQLCSTEQQTIHEWCRSQQMTSGFRVQQWRGHYAFVPIPLFRDSPHDPSRIGRCPGVELLGVCQRFPENLSQHECTKICSTCTMVKIFYIYIYSFLCIYSHFNQISC